jgi:hypothetical protein
LDVVLIHTKMLRTVLGVSWKDKVNNAVLYGKLPKLSYKIKAGDKDWRDTVSDVLKFWQMI